MLPQENRLRKGKEVEEVFKTGKSVFDPVCGFKYQKNNLDKSRFVIMVGTKIFKSAVKRNRLKRQISEILRLNKEKIKIGYDFTFIVRPDALRVNYQEIERRILGGLRRVGLIDIVK
jgi:ribonuclease P protein component